MTGTPIQNGLEDLGALIRFLKLPILEDVVVFRRYICAEAEPTKGQKNQDFSNLRLLLGSICLRRAQSTLPFHSTTDTVRLQFTEDERKDYRSLEVVCKQALMMAVNSKKSKAAHQNVLEKLLRLREFCNGIRPSATTSPEALFSLMQQTGEALCSYCSV